MRILIDQDVDAAGNVMANHWLHTDVAPWNMVQDPSNPGVQIDMITFLGRLKGNAVLQGQHGYNVRNTLPGEALPQTRWQRVVRAMNGPLASAAERAVNLV